MQYVDHSQSYDWKQTRLEDLWVLKAKKSKFVCWDS